MLEVENLTVSYGAHRALEDVSVRVVAGEICVILGANGAGKSTLLKGIGGLVPVSPGSRITVDGRDITGAKPHSVVEAGLALVPEGRGIFGDLTVAENLQLGAYGKQARAVEQHRLAEVLELFPRLGERRRQIARTMSGGEQQMVAIGRALMSNPRILMLDEPSLGLSPILTKDLFKSLAAVGKTGVGILLVEQNAKQSLAIADRGYLIENGHITGEGTGSDLANDPAVQSAYLGGASAKTRAGTGKPRPERPTVPSVSNLSPDGADAAIVLAQRAARIQRDYVLSLRENMGWGGRANGHHHPVAEQLSAKGDTIAMSRQAHDLSMQAAEFAKNAARIQKGHVEAVRARYAGRSAPAMDSSSTTGPAAAIEGARANPAAAQGGTGDWAAEMAERAARIQREYYASRRS